MSDRKNQGERFEVVGHEPPREPTMEMTTVPTVLPWKDRVNLFPIAVREEREERENPRNTEHESVRKFQHGNTRTEERPQKRVLDLEDSFTAFLSCRFFGC